MHSASNCGNFSLQGVDLALVKDTADVHTGTAIITVADADNTIVVVPGANALVSAEDVAAPVLAKGDVAVSQFEIPQATIAAFFKRARAAGATTILNPAPAIACRAGVARSRRYPDSQRDRAWASRAAPNFTIPTSLPVSSKRRDACRPRQDKIICVTLGKRGVLALVGGEPSLIAGRAVKAVDTTGAGDCFVGALAAQLANGKAIRDALEYANAAASICVQRMGAAPSMPTAAEVAALRG